MPRQVRIEYEGAFYHVMARGNRHAPIFSSTDGSDEELFVRTLGEACKRCGFRVWAWVLMRNHYHVVLETPRGNLVAGMSWLQNTYTRRFNARHGDWGRLFGDRYKSVLVEGRDSGGDSYLQTLMDYVHLNPARAGIVSVARGENILDYRWSSAASGYASSPTKRPDWLAVEDGLALFGFRDRTRDRRGFIERLDARIAAEDAESCGSAEMEGRGLRGTLESGWYWGSESFKEGLLDRLEAMPREAMPASKPYRSSRQANDQALREAERIIADAAVALDLEGTKPSDFASLPRGDSRRVAVAWALARRTRLPQRWIADRLSMRTPGNVSEQVRRFAIRPVGSLEPPVRAWTKRMD